MNDGKLKTTALAIAILLLRAAAPEARAAEAPRPNVVLVFADQWRADALGYAGDPNVKTPNLDRLASQSVNFTLAVSSCPVCCPYRASLMTGQRPLTHGVFLNDVPLADEARTVAEVFRDAGYATAYLGKWHLDGRGRSNYIPPERRQGFEYFKALECTHDYNRSLYYAQDDPARRTWEDYDAIAQTRDAQAYLAGAARRAKPFLLMISWGPPHNPYETAPTKYRAMYDPAAIRLRPNVPDDRAAAARRELAGYYAHCTALDDCVAELWKTLRETGLERDTIFVFTSDHGDMLHSHAMQRKQKPWDESIRVPLLIRFPSGLGEAGRKVDEPIATEDLMPTLLGLAGVPVPDGVEGLDFSRLLRGGQSPGDGAAVVTCVAPFGEFTRKGGGREYRGIRTRRHTYVRSLDGPWLLFDNQADPYQLQNLVGRPEHADVQAELDAMLSRKLEQAGDRFLPGADYVEKWGWQTDATGTVRYAR